MQNWVLRYSIQIQLKHYMKMNKGFSMPKGQVNVPSRCAHTVLRQSSR